ncbi:MAG: RpiB/LacA/LacB family sugar-phosphate isomerase [Thaumarchaeota archaeon]|jgi:ribose 5-phosphate isomerase B|nr:RpiB/LacA/LacB family sugar-phosphate isomerase [Candidatus Wolframiiraptor allenii]
MRIAVGSDDVYHVARVVVEHLRSRGHEVEELGALRSGRLEPWPNVAWEVARRVMEGLADYGIVICYTGTGVSIAANKVRGIRCALCPDAETARGARRWNDANMLALSARLTSDEVAKEIVDAFLSIEKPDESELENIRKIMEMEKL